MARKQLVKLSATLIERSDAADGVYGGDETDKNGREVDHHIGYPGVVRVRPASDVFKDVETMSLRNIICVKD